jgi:hypothetical protein
MTIDKHKKDSAFQQKKIASYKTMMTDLLAKLHKKTPGGSTVLHRGSTIGSIDESITLNSPLAMSANVSQGIRQASQGSSEVSRCSSARSGGS